MSAAPVEASEPSEERLDATVEAVVFDWDGTAVPDRGADASTVREAVEALCTAGVHVVVVSGTHVGNVDAQLGARPRGPGSLHLCLNRGSEVFAVTPDGPVLVERRQATAAEEHSLDLAASRLVAELADRGLVSEVVSARLNRRKIDLIPEPAWADPPKARIDELLDAVRARLADAGIAGLAAVEHLAVAAAQQAGLREPRITTDVKHIEIGLTDKSDSGRWAARWLRARGITGNLVLVVGDELGPLGGVVGSDSWMVVPELSRALVVSVGVEPEGVPPGVLHLGGGPAQFGELLTEQLVRRCQRRVPSLDEDPAWCVLLPPEPALERIAESLGALANGASGTRAAREEDGVRSTPLFVVGGVYAAVGPALRSGPVWTALPTQVGEPDRRLLDLRTGMLARATGPPGQLRSVRFASLARPAVLAMRVEGTGPGPVEADGASRDGSPPVMERTPEKGAGIAVARRDRRESEPGGWRLERVAAWAANPDGPADPDEALRALADAEDVGFDQLAAEQRRAWADRWAVAGASIEGDDDLDRAVRFALFHLLAAAPSTGEAAVGARGLTGPAYGGHVFWDADVYVLPALAALRPAAARAILEYRIRRLPAARAAARAAGCAGARFPWESARTGDDVTPETVPNPGGGVIEVTSGEHEEHIVADIAWAACRYAAWTGDRAFLLGPGRDLVLDTARWWASRISLDAAGSGHIDDVMGPDEYHEHIDDNAFTNVMARWNLRTAAALLEDLGGDPEEAATWRRLAGQLVDGWDDARGLHEQFAGYWDLEPLLIEPLAKPPVAIDLLLGADRVAASQLIKQPDVLMLHHLVPGELPSGSLDAALDHYGPRTAHGSSLSPAIHASLLARAGRPEEALELLRVAAFLDLDDLTGTTASGLHLATMGGLWQALAWGFMGLRAEPDALAVDPVLPRVWRSLRLVLSFRGQRVEVGARPGRLEITCADPLPIRLAHPGGTRSPTIVQPPGATFELRSLR